jgi:hypothetical protein
MADEIPPRNVYSDADRHQQPYEEGHKLLSARTHPRVESSSRFPVKSAPDQIVLSQIGPQVKTASK